MAQALFCMLPWIAAAAGCTIMTIIQAESHADMPEGWWKPTAKYTVYAIVVAVIYSLFVLMHVGIL